MLKWVTQLFSDGDKTTNYIWTGGDTSKNVLCYPYGNNSVFLKIALFFLNEKGGSWSDIQEINLLPYFQASSYYSVIDYFDR